MVHNYMYDSIHNETFWVGRNPEAWHSFWWEGGDPVWITARRQVTTDFNTCSSIDLQSSSFHRLDMTLAVAEALSPNKPNQAGVAEPEGGGAQGGFSAPPTHTHFSEWGGGYVHPLLKGKQGKIKSIESIF